MSKEYEIVPGVKVTDANNYSVNGKKLDTSKYKQLDRSSNGATVPAQAFVDKLSKHYAYHVCKSGIDPEKKLIWYEIMINADKSEVKTVSYAEAAKCFGWKSFKLSANGIAVIPQK